MDVISLQHTLLQLSTVYLVALGKASFLSLCYKHTRFAIDHPFLLNVMRVNNWLEVDVECYGSLHNV